MALYEVRVAQIRRGKWTNDYVYWTGNCDLNEIMKEIMEKDMKEQEWGGREGFSVLVHVKNCETDEYIYSIGWYGYQTLRNMKADNQEIQKKLQEELQNKPNFSTLYDKFNYNGKIEFFNPRYGQITIIREFDNETLEYKYHINGEEVDWHKVYRVLNAVAMDPETQFSENKVQEGV